MNKFENVDLFDSLGAIMRQNTAFYQSDFEIDKQIIQKAAEAPPPGIKRCFGLPARRGRIVSESATFF